DKGARALFEVALADIAERDRPDVRSIALRALGEDPAAVAHMLPIKGAALNLFQRAETLLVISPLVERQAASTDLLSGLFDLTPGEARVARAVSEGKSIADLAVSLGVSRETLRSQLKSVFAE